jgi:hypothetical protein
MFLHQISLGSATFADCQLGHARTAMLVQAVAENRAAGDAPQICPSALPWSASRHLPSIQKPGWLVTKCHQDIYILLYYIILFYFILYYNIYIYILYIYIYYIYILLYIGTWGIFWDVISNVMESSEDGGPIDGNLVGKLKMKNM